MSSDDAIRATNDDAASCKRFAVQQGYWKDPYIQYFVRSSERKAPEINRGYFARVVGIRTLMKQFLEITKCKCQVLNLGAGFDTNYWVLKDEGQAPQNFIEVDFSGVTSRKIHNVKGRKQLLEKMSQQDEIRFDGHDFHAADYHLVAADMRNLTELQKKLKDCDVDKSLPLLVIAECVLVYMDADKSAELLKWLAQNFNSVFFVNYEQVNMMDRFGQVMIENLRARQCTLHGVEFCKNLETQKERFTSQGWEGANSWEMTHVYRGLPQAEIQRIERLEFLDEQEGLTQLLQHYCITWAYKDGAGIGLSRLGFQAQFQSAQEQT